MFKIAGRLFPRARTSFSGLNPARSLRSSAPQREIPSSDVASSSISKEDASNVKGSKRTRMIAPITLTVRAADRIKEMISGKEDVVGVRLGVKRRGCNGYSYTMNYANDDDVDPKKNEIVREHDVTVLVDPKAVFFMVGTTMDYNETELAAEFTFVNPNVKGECGCGESFNL